MKTKVLIDYLKEDYNLRHPYDKRMRNKIIKRLKEHDELKSMNEGLLNFLGDIGNSLKKQSNQVDKSGK